MSHHLTSRNCLREKNLCGWLFKGHLDRPALGTETKSAKHIQFLPATDIYIRDDRRRSWRHRSREDADNQISQDSRLKNVRILQFRFNDRILGHQSP